jgi:succinate-acetate transporter protein
MNPYIFTALLLFFGLWCFYDGWLTSDPEMQEHALFNRVLSIVLLPWGVYDFFKIRKARNTKSTDQD